MWVIPSLHPGFWWTGGDSTILQETIDIVVTGWFDIFFCARRITSLEWARQPPWLPEAKLCTVFGK
jgi:hypothetical protein